LTGPGFEKNGGRKVAGFSMLEDLLVDAIRKLLPTGEDEFLLLEDEGILR